jgi:hypothetical protein
MRTATFTGKGYTHAAQEIDYRPYPVTVEILKDNDGVMAKINGVPVFVENVTARSANAAGSRITVSIDTGRYEALVTVTRKQWERAVTAMQEG